MSLLTVSPTQSEIQTALRSFLVSILPSSVPVVQGQGNRVPQVRAPDFVVFTDIRRERLSTNVSEFADCSFTASIAGTLMNVTALEFGTIEIGDQLFGTGLVAGTTTVIDVVSGSGGVGSYTVSPGQAVPSQGMACGVQQITQPGEIVFQVDVYGPNSADNAQVVTTLFRDAYATQFFEAASPEVSPLHADDPRQVPFLDENDQIETRWIVEARLQANQSLKIAQQFADTLSVETVSVDEAYPP